MNKSSAKFPCERELGEGTKAISDGTEMNRPFVGHMILRGTRIVITETLRKRVIEHAHEGHQGIVKTKERLRSKVSWPGIDQAAERKCRECYDCQLVVKQSL